MSLYLVQPRTIRHVSGPKQPKLPATLEVRLKLGPPDAFGVKDSLPRTTIRAGESPGLIIHSDEGTSTIEGSWVEELDFTEIHQHIKICGEGDRLTLAMHVGVGTDLKSFLLALGRYIPAHLSLRFGTFVWIREYTASIGLSSYRLEAGRGMIGVRCTTAEEQKASIVGSVASWTAAESQHNRWLAAVYYYRNALRLGALEPDRHAVFAEVILNLAKVVDVLLTSTRDKIRGTAMSWGFPEDYVEKQLVSIVLIRNQLDVAHAKVSPLTEEEKDILERFVIKATQEVGEFLKRVFDLMVEGRIRLRPSSKKRSGHAKLLAKIGSYLEERKP